MGRAKEQLEAGWRQIEDSNVCVNCFEDVGIKRFIKKNLHEIGCDYCHDDNAKKRKSSNINSVIEFINDCIHKYYEDPDVLEREYELIRAWEREKGGFFLTHPSV